MTIQTQLMPTGEQLLFDFILADLSALYDRIYNIADKLIKKHNPCNIHTTKKGFVLCKQYHHHSFVAWQQKQGHFLCCHACKYQSKTGCPIKCLPCKLFYCGFVTNKILKNRLRRLKNIAEKCGIVLYPYYRTKTQILKDSLKKEYIC